MPQNKTLDYYNLNADNFAKQTVDVEFEQMQYEFTSRLPEGARVLDFGCGSGRDTKYFLSRGYKVEAVDGSYELCRIASEYTGIEVKQMLFEELAEEEKYDGIWACSSILHLSGKELKSVIQKMTRALKHEGIIYTSFKYGTFEGERNGRYFTDMTEETFSELLRETDKLCDNKIENNLANEKLTIEKQWITSDARPGRGEEKWLNLILRRM